MTLMWRRLLRWLGYAKERESLVTVPATADSTRRPRAVEEQHYVPPQYCGSGCGRRDKECESGGQPHSNCNDIYVPPPFFPGGIGYRDVSRGGHYDAGSYDDTHNDNPKFGMH